MEWIKIEERWPEINKPDNVCFVQVKADDGTEFRCLYGTSGAPGEGFGFFSSKKITHWKPEPPKP